jgi:hypothetical protein
MFTLDDQPACEVLRRKGDDFDARREERQQVAFNGFQLAPRHSGVFAHAEECKDRYFRCVGSVADVYWW